MEFRSSRCDEKVFRNSDPLTEQLGPLFSFPGPFAVVLIVLEDLFGPSVLADGPTCSPEGPLLFRAGPNDKPNGPVGESIGPTLPTIGPVAKFLGPTFRDIEPLGITRSRKGCTDVPLLKFWGPLLRFPGPFETWHDPI